MKKKVILWIGIFLLLMIAYFVSRSFLGTTFTSNNFPLSEKWSTRFGNDIQQISIIDNKIVLARTAAELYAMDVKSGKVLWHHTSGWSNANEPAFAKNEIVFFTDDKWILALNQADGEILWQKLLDSPQSAQVVDASQDKVAVFDTENLKVYQTFDGTLLWSKHVCRNSTQAYFYDTNLYFPCLGLDAVDIKTGHTVWETHSDEIVWAAAYADGVMYSSPDLDSITAFDLQNQKQIWSTHLASDPEQGFTISDEYLFMTDQSKFCVLLRNSGKVLWCTRNIINPQNPVKVGNIVYIFNGLQNTITAFDLSSGNRIGKLFMSNLNIFTLFRHILVSSDELMIFGSGHEVFAFGK